MVTWTPRGFAPSTLLSTLSSRRGSRERKVSETSWVCSMPSSKVKYLLIGAKYTGQNQPLKLNTSPSQIMNGNKILGFQLIYMLSVQSSKAVFHGTHGFQELCQEDERHTFHLYPSSSPRGSSWGRVWQCSYPSRNFPVVWITADLPGQA